MNFLKELRANKDRVVSDEKIKRQRALKQILDVPTVQKAILNAIDRGQLRICGGHVIYGEPKYRFERRRDEMRRALASELFADASEEREYE